MDYDYVVGFTELSVGDAEQYQRYGFDSPISGDDLARLRHGIK